MGLEILYHDNPTWGTTRDMFSALLWGLGIAVGGRAGAPGIDKIIAGWGSD